MPAAPALANSNAFPGQPAEAPAAPLLGTLNLTPTGTSGEQFQTEISATVTIGGKLFVLSSGGGSTLQVTDATDATQPELVGRESYGDGYVSTSVASYGDLLAVALSPADYDTTGGKGLVRFYRVGVNGTLTQIADVVVGYLPDGIAFNETGTKLVIANEGQPAAGYTLDRPGSIGIIDIQGRVNPVFTYTDLLFDNVALPEGIRISGPTGTTQATDIEPEYVAIQGIYAYVTLQENNGVAKVNLATNTIEKIFSLGTVDYSTQLVDLSDKDGGFKPMLGQDYEGLRMADGIAAYSVKGKDYFITANEGDGREYGTYTDEARGSGNANRVKRLTDDANVGTDLTTTFGSRSITIFDADTGAMLWDSGNTLQTIAFAAGVYDDGRSDDKGAEPEGVVVAKVDGRTYAIVSLERGVSSMLAVFDVSDPTAGQFVTSTVIAGSISPEGLLVVDAKQSPTGRTQLVVSNEISNTLNIFDLEALIAAPPVAGAGTFTSTMLKDVEGGPELQITSLLTAGEFTNGLNPGDSVYAPTSIFDGQGAYDNGDGTYTLLVNSELGSTSGYGYLLPGVEGGFTGARVSSLVIDKDVDDDASNGYQSAVIAGGLAYDSIYLDGSDTAIDEAADLGAGFKRFCAANLVEANSFGADMGFADRIYLVGEEEFVGAGGSFFALDVNGRAIHEVLGFGKGTWESATSIDTGSTDTVAVLLFDDAKAPLYMWVGTKSAAADASFLERNGLAASQGTLYTYVTTALDGYETGASTGPDSSDLFAFTEVNGINTAINGSWVDLASLNADYASLGAPALRELAVNAGALQLSRIEDGEVNPLNSQQAVFVSTGTADFNKGDLYGNVYTLDFSAAFGSDGLVAASGESVLKVVYDGDLLDDPTTGLRNPDNMTISADGFAYLQEDRANGGGTDISAGNFGTQEASIWQLEIDSITGDSIGDPTRWAQIDRTVFPTDYGQTQPTYTNPDTNGVGNWESSGIIDVSAIYDSTAGSYFLANVQAHSIKDGNIGGSGYLGEGGQIDLIQQTI
ncbi:MULTISPECIES: choice-of-anchor I family protein [unclassified Cyanobium]|uniref:choice-of-anchor I family protein n=1 Tax=unclassified Cyanobium TaxID=2627006 RepID=UPI0020CD9CE5|nr:MULTISPECIES: choice-of-anchor I family protein [unclassified Cyanobium]MCP9776610.1 choice-of-anchor I family protein [Cyanobium sp. Tous-M-B4]MCP9876777.1 choice-of-anchor I family protein [Cyanobium sp. A2C-AMD]